MYKFLLFLIITFNCFSQNYNIISEAAAGAKIYSLPDDKSNVITSLFYKSNITILEILDDFYKINYEEKIGYIKKYWITDNPIIKDLEKKIYNDKLEKEKYLINQKKIQKINDSLNEIAEQNKILKQEILLQSKKDYIIKKKYGVTILNKLKKKLIWIGMNKEMAIYSFGNPNKINRTVTKYSISEQWVYDNLYLYFENGTLNSFQD